MKKPSSTSKSKWTVLITGVNGFLGSHLARALLNEGAAIHGLTRNPDAPAYLEWENLSEKIMLHAGDIRDSSALENIFSENKFTHVFHLAAESDTWRSAERPRETFETNVGGTLNVLEFCRTQEEKPCIIFGGSVRVFHYQPKSGIRTMNGGGLHAYDASKAMSEMLVGSYLQTYGFPGAIVRNTNLYGENDLNFRRLVPRIMEGVFGKMPLSLQGDGSLQRDFLHV